jgi:uncharacterized membrane protein YqiK
VFGGGNRFVNKFSEKKFRKNFVNKFSEKKLVGFLRATVS